MPQFSQQQIACLRDTMLQRLPESYFTPEDVKSIQDKTGLDVVQIRAWAEKLRYMVPGDKRLTYLTRGRVLISPITMFSEFIALNKFNLKIFNLFKFT